MPSDDRRPRSFPDGESLVQMMGEDKAFDYLKALNANVNSYTKSGVAPGKAVARGETTVGINYAQDILVEKNAGFPIELALPCEGTAAGVDGMSIVKGGPNPENAIAFYEWALTPDGLSAAAQGGLLHDPANVNSKRPQGTEVLSTAKLIDYDYAKFAAKDERARLIQRWEDEVNINH
ncbi:extracellular solute-binding protein [Shinella sp. S4-D37]|uniref:extracellular solute-binding protein n=1 Tax=Shinella sp. S4-D37 TaxID=3161999 RepID=UPI003466B447